MATEINGAEIAWVCYEYGRLVGGEIIQTSADDREFFRAVYVTEWMETS